MRVLVVAPKLPYPPNHGQRLRTWHLLRGLSLAQRDIHVTLVTWIAGEPPEHVDRVRAAVDNLIALPLDAARTAVLVRLLRHLRFFVGGPPAYVQAMAEERQSGLDAMSMPAGFDLIVLEEEALADMGLPDLGAPVVLHRLNVFERVVADVAPQNWFRRLTRRPELAAWRRFDRRVSERATHVIATTTDSAAVLRDIAPQVPLDVVTNGVEIPQRALRPSEGLDVAFIGWMGYPANVDAARWLVEEIWPRVRVEVPGSRVRIIGREPSPSVWALARDDVVVTGEVPDVVEAAAGARVGVVPLRGGMGIKNKTLELLAMGLPVVSTPAGVEGLPAPLAGVMEPGSDANAFAEAIIRLLRDPAEADALGAAGRAYVAAAFSWEPIGRRYAEILERVSSSR